MWLLVAAAALTPPTTALSTLSNEGAPVAEQRAFLTAHKGTIKAVKALSAKLEWVRDEGGVCGVDIAPFMRSEGFIVTLEGCFDRDGRPILYSRGILHGSKRECQKQALYAYERCLAQSVASGRDTLSTLTIVDVRAPSFRFPDAACISSIRLAQRHYPWVSSSGSRMVFLSCPTPVKWAFERLKPFMSVEQYESITFVDGKSDLCKYVAPSQLPAFLGGTAAWEMEGYIAERCAAEGVADEGCTKSYTGHVIDWKPLDDWDERRRAKRRPASDEAARPCVAKRAAEESTEGEDDRGAPDQGEGLGAQPATRAAGDVSDSRSESEAATHEADAGEPVASDGTRSHSWRSRLRRLWHGLWMRVRRRVRT